MRKTTAAAAAFGIILLTAMAATAETPCTPVKIQSGGVVDSKGNTLKTGYDQYGYNYVAHMFNGLADNFTRPDPIATEGTENLVMKWSDDWLANVSCAEFAGTPLEGKLARGYNAKAGTVSASDTSMGWCTNHYEGDYLGSDGELHHYTYFAKIVYVGPAPASNDPWATARIWGSYAIVEELQNDQFGEYGGRLKSDKLVAPGLGQFIGK